jgi:hypothetical protein
MKIRFPHLSDDWDGSSQLLVDHEGEDAHHRGPAPALLYSVVILLL